MVVSLIVATCVAPSVLSSFFVIGETRNARCARLVNFLFTGSVGSEVRYHIGEAFVFTISVTISLRFLSGLLYHNLLIKHLPILEKEY